MVDARHFCPDCGGIDISVQRKHILISEAEDTGATASCPNCGWAGPLSKTVGAATTEQFWDINRVGDVLLRVVSKHAAGPFIQVMEFVGLLPKRLDLDAPHELSYAERVKHNELVDQMRSEIVKAMLAASISSGFEVAERMHRIYAVKYNKPLASFVKEDHQNERVFGDRDDTKKVKKSS
jgi:predicted RNA-binding Zn-ribbon protein involved in translation (DUF1610 family)